MNAGDICWIDFPPRSGHAQSGRRPAIIVQSSVATAHLPTVLVVPVTTQLGALRFSGTVPVAASEENGLRRDSVVLAFQLTVLDKQAVGERLGAAAPDVMKRIWQAFDEVTERPAQ